MELFDTLQDILDLFAIFTKEDALIQWIQNC